MEGVLDFIQMYIDYAPTIIFILILLAGLNIPISLDVLMVFSVISAATIAPHLTLHFFFAILFGSIMSAWICFNVGRFLGPHIDKVPLLRQLISKEKIASIGTFYQKYGLFSLIVGRFIPFGVRNLIFLSKGISPMPFRTFALYDGIACTLWATLVFWTLYYVGESFEQLMAVMKRGNVLIFSLFGMSLIVFFCYKYLLKKKAAQ